MPVRYELVKGKSSKFWEIALAGKGITVTWGRIGTEGRSLTKAFPTPAAARTGHDKLVREKLREGYVATDGAGSAKKSARTARPAPKGGALQSIFLHVSHHQFEVEDADHQWEQQYKFETTDDGIETLAHGTAVHLRRAARTIPIVIEVRADPAPDPTWQFHLVSEGSFDCPSGKVAVMSPEASDPTLIPAPRGTLRIQVRQAELDTSDYDGGFGADHYRVVLWPGVAGKTRVLSTAKISGDEPEIRPPRLKLGDVEALLRSKDPSDRCHAAVESVRHLRAGNAKALAPISRACKDVSEAVRAVLTSALGVAGDAQRAKVLTLLDALAADKSADVRRRVPEALVRLGGSAAVSRMLRLLVGKHEDLATEAATWIWVVQDDVDARDLVPILKSRSPRQRLAGLRAIQRIGGDGHWDTVAPAGDAVRGLIEDKNLEVRKLAVELAGKIGVPLDDLLRLARSPTAKIRESAARSLGEAKNPVAYDALVKLVGDKDLGVRREAAAGLGLLGDKRAVPILAKLLEDGAYNVNWYASRGLAYLGGPAAVAELFRYAGQPDADEKFQYIGSQATERLADMLKAAAGRESIEDISADIDVSEAQKRANELAADADARVKKRGRRLLALCRNGAAEENEDEEADDAPTPYRTMDEWRPLMREALAAGDRRRCIGYCDAAFAQHPEEVDMIHVRGILQAELGLAAEAEASYREVLAIDPSHEHAQNRLSNLLLDQQRNEEAEALMIGWVRQRPAIATLHYDIGVAASRRGDKRQALDALGEGLRLDPTLAETAPDEFVMLRDDADFKALLAAKQRPANVSLWYLAKGHGTVTGGQTGGGGLANGLERLRSMVRELEARDDVVLLNWDVGEPASDDVLDGVEKQLGFSLPPSVREVYRQADGLSLRWIHRDNPVFDPKQHRRVKGRLVPGFVRKTRVPEGLDVIQNSGADDGCICLLPVREAFIDASWSDMTYFDWMTDDEKMDRDGKSYGLLSFSRSLRIFDFFSYYEMAAFLMLEESRPVIVGTDHGADWTGPAIDFRTYWEFVLAHYGSVQARSEAFNRWNRKDDAASVHSRPGALDDVLTICRRGWAAQS